MDLKNFEAIIFDSDGVLVDSEIIHIEVERELLGELGLDYGHEEYLSRFVGLSNRDFYKELAADYRTRIGGKFPADFGETLQARLWPRVLAELQPIGGVRALVNSFEGKVAIASSAPASRLQKKLLITGLTELFAPHIYSADQVQNGKPAPDLFLFAAEAIEVAPKDCLVIEDSVNGVRAAKSAGMTAIGFTGGGHCDEGLRSRLIANGADLVCSSHAEIEGLFRAAE